MKKAVIGLAGAAAALVIFVLATFPYRFADLESISDPAAMAMIPTRSAVFDARPGKAAGTVMGRWLVEPIAPGTWALGEPADNPDNYEYLLVGAKRALLIDAGMTRQPINPVLTRLTPLPVTVIPTHFHDDHTNGIHNFQSVALIDLPETRSLEQDGIVTPGRYRAADAKPLHFRVTEWVKPDQAIDLGGRQVTVLSTSGHTSSSASMLDSATHALFTGDYIYPTSQWLFMTDSSLAAFRATADRLLATLPASTILYGAHCCRNDAPPHAPWLTMADLKDVRDTVAAVQAGTAKGKGWPITRYPVNSRMTLLTAYPLANW